MATSLESHVIYSNPDTLGGTPVFRGTRVPIQVLFDYLREESLEEFFLGYPSISKEMVNSVLSIAEKRLFIKKRNRILLSRPAKIKNKTLHENAA